MVESPVVERGVLTAPGPAWDAAVQRAEVIGRLAAKDTVGLVTADEAADELGISRRQVYALVRRWRSGEGVASDLLPGRSSGGRGGARLPDEVEAIVREVLRSRYLTRQRRSVAAVCREIARQCRVRGLRVPSRGTVLRRIEQLDPVKSVSAREGADAHTAGRPAGSGGAGADRPHPGGRDRGRRAAPVADRPPVRHGGDLRVQPVRGRAGGHVGGAVGDRGWGVPGAHGHGQAGRAGTARGGGGVADERQAARAVRGQRRRVQERGPAPGLRPARHSHRVPAAGPAAFRWDRGAADRHDDADGARRAAGHHVLQHRPARRLRQRRQGRDDPGRVAAVVGAGGGLLPRPNPRRARPYPGRRLGRPGRRARRPGDRGQRDGVPGGLPAGDPPIPVPHRLPD